LNSIKEGIKVSQPPSNLPPGLSFARRTTAPVKLPRPDFTRLGGPVVSQPTRVGELAPDVPVSMGAPGQHLIAFRQPEAPPPDTAAVPSGGAIQSNYLITPGTPAPFARALPLDGGQQATAPIPLGDAAPTISVKEEPPSMMTTSGTAIPDAREAARVIVYGRSGSAACMRAIQDLMERQVSFHYVDVSRDSAAAAHLTSICNGEPVVPVIVHIGFGGV
jgi:hypothetical protein